MHEKTEQPSRWKRWAKRLLVLWAVSNVVCSLWHWHFDRDEWHGWQCRECGANLSRTPDGQLYYDGVNRFYGYGHGHKWKQVAPRARFTLWKPWNWLSDLLIRPYNPTTLEDEAKKLPHNSGVL